MTLRATALAFLCSAACGSRAPGPSVDGATIERQGDRLTITLPGADERPPCDMSRPVGLILNAATPIEAHQAVSRSLNCELTVTPALSAEHTAAVSHEFSGPGEELLAWYREWMESRGFSVAVQANAP